MATTSFNVNFYINYGSIVVPTVFIEDTTDYAGQGIAPSNLNGNLKITSPSGVVIYENTDFTDGGCDMHQVVTPSIPFNVLPLTPGGAVQIGDYTILYTVYNKATTAYYNVERVVSFNYVRPKLNIQHTVDYTASLFSSKDSTVYTVNNVVPLNSIYDHNLYYPPGSAGFGTPVLTSNLIINTGVFYPGTQTTTIFSRNSYTFIDTVGSLFIVHDTVTGSKDVVVSTNDLCSVYCCMAKLNDRILKAKCSNSKELSYLLSLAAEVGFVVSLINTAKACGYTNDITGYLEQIQNILGCSDDCDDCQ